MRRKSYQLGKTFGFVAALGAAVLTTSAAWAVTPTSTIIGTVTGTNAAGTQQGVSNVRVVAVSSSGSAVGRGMTTATGSYSISVPNGTYNGTYTVSPRTPGFSYGARQSVTVPPSKTANFLARPVISGRVTNSAGTGGIGGVRIIATNTANAALSSSTHDVSSGFYNLIVPRAGTYSVRAVRGDLTFLPPPTPVNACNCELQRHGSLNYGTRATLQ